MATDLERLRRGDKNLGYADLSDTDLRHADLRHADLIGADLTGARTRMCIVNFSPSEYKQAKQFIEGLKEVIE